MLHHESIHCLLHPILELALEICLHVPEQKLQILSHSIVLVHQPRNGLFVFDLLFLSYRMITPSSNRLDSVVANLDMSLSPS